MSGYKIDIGCGSCKKPGYLGVDLQAAPEVDHVVDLRAEPLPFPDKSVISVFSSHFLEHIADPTKIFSEISRVAMDGAKLELWTPYAWSNSAFIIDHKLFFNEDHYLHICNWFVDFWKNILHARWILHEFQYVIPEVTLIELYKQNVDLDFAIRYHKGVVKEFCAHIEVRRTYSDDSVPNPRRTFSFDRDSTRYLLSDRANPDGTTEILNAAISKFSSGTIK